MLKQEREEQADLVKMIRDAEKIGMFNKGYKIKSTTDQRKTRYAIAAKQVPLHLAITLPYWRSYTYQ